MTRGSYAHEPRASEDIGCSGRAPSGQDREDCKAGCEAYGKQPETLGQSCATSCFYEPDAEGACRLWATCGRCKAERKPRKPKKLILGLDEDSDTYGSLA